MRQAALTLAVRLVAVIAGLVSSIATARYLGPEGRGFFFFWSTVAAVLVQFGNFGLHASNIYLHARKGVDHATLGANSLFAACVGGAVLSAAALAILHMTGRDAASDPMIMAAVLLLSGSGLYFLLGMNLLVAMGKLTEFNLLELGSRLFGLTVLVLTLVTITDPRILLLATALAAFVAACALLLRLLRHAPLSKPSWPVFRSGLAYGARAYVAACLAALMARLNAFLLEPAIPAADYGAWSISAQMIDMMLLVPQSIALVLLPRMMRSEDPHALLRVNAMVTTGVLVAVMAVFATVGQPVIGLLYGAEFSAAYEYVLWGMPGLLALGIISILSQYLAAIGIPAMLILLWGVVVLLHGLLASALIPEMGATGAMASQSVGYVAALALVFLLVRLKKNEEAEDVLEH